jgi:hypothetical protein
MSRTLADLLKIQKCDMKTLKVQVGGWNAWEMAGVARLEPIKSKPGKLRLGDDK